jgi:hypothetical protein
MRPPEFSAEKIWLSTTALRTLHLTASEFGTAQIEQKGVMAMGWKVGFGEVDITPPIGVWLTWVRSANETVRRHP